jgi:Carboxypeptidase regulatory-like domain
MIAAAGVASEGGPPDLSKGQINGRVATMAFPITRVESASGGAGHDRFLSVENCLVHLGPFTAPDDELLYPCGKWFQPPAEGSYRVWLEMPGLISEGHSVLMWEDEPFTGRGLALAMGVEPAGTIALAPTVPIGNEQSFRFVLLRGVHKGKLRPAFDRRLSGDRARKGAAVATGSVLAGIFDRKTDDAIALARPVEVRAGKTSFATPAPPAKGSDVLVVLGRPAPAVAADPEVNVVLQVDGNARRPDAFSASASNLFAVWYGVEGRSATLVAESSAVQLPPTVLRLTPGKVTTLRARLNGRPRVRASISGPEDRLRGSRLALELRTDPANELLQKLDARVNGEFQFDAVAPGAYKVVLLVDDWEFRKRVTLTDDGDEDVAFALSPLVVSGVVYHGRDPAPLAEVAFDIGRTWMRVKADDGGRYEAIFWKPDEYIAQIDVPERNGPPFLDGGFDIQESRTIDFHVPNTRFAVNVRDAVTGKPIAGARVIAGSIYERSGGPGRSSQTAITDADGRAMLPPLRPGEMSIRAQADGYLDSDTQRDVVTRNDARGDFTISLRPVGETISATIRNPDGTPASAAQVWAVGATGGHQPPLWSGAADANGVIAIPRAVRNATFLIRPRDAAVAVRRLEREDEVTWSLVPAARLTVHAARRSRIAVWIDDVRLTGRPLGLLTGAFEATDNEGVWSSASLPVRSLRVLAWRTASVAAVESGSYDLAATPLAYPWPRVVELQPVD